MGLIQRDRKLTWLEDVRYMTTKKVVAWSTLRNGCPPGHGQRPAAATMTNVFKRSNDATSISLTDCLNIYILRKIFNSAHSTIKK